MPVNHIPGLYISLEQGLIQVSLFSNPEKVISFICATFLYL